MHNVDFEHAWGRATLPVVTIRGERRKGEVLITVAGAPLDWRSSLAVRNQLADRPGVGLRRLGTGPASELALATAERFYQRFKWDVLAPIEAAGWALDAGDVLGWLEQAAGMDDHFPATVSRRSGTVVEFAARASTCGLTSEESRRGWRSIRVVARR